MFRILHDGGSYRILEADRSGPAQYRIDGQILEPEPGIDLFAVVERMHTSGLGRGRVDLDLRHLTHVNSTGLKALVRWIQLLRAAAHIERYRLYVLPSFEYDWQRTSLRDLARFAGADLALAEEPEGAAQIPESQPPAEPSEDEPSSSGLSLGDRLK